MRMREFNPVIEAAVVAMERRHGVQPVPSVRDNPEFDRELCELNQDRDTLHQLLTEARRAAATTQILVGRMLAFHDQVKNRIDNRRDQLGLQPEADGGDDE